jgi:hypothetical protein
MNKPKELLAVYDNGGNTYDRYTIILKNGDVLGASENPFNLLGFGQFNHNIADTRMTVEYGASWRKRCDVKKCTKYAIDKYLNDVEILKTIGKEVDWIILPKNVQQYIVMNCDPIEQEFK